MAEVISIVTLAALLDQAVRAKAGVAWIDPANGLVVGESFAAPDFVVQFGKEALLRVGGGEGLAARGADPGTLPLRNAAAPAFSDPASTISGARRTGHYRLILEGKPIAAQSQKELLLRGLSAIEATRPGTLERLARERSRTKRVVARRRHELNTDEKLANRFSQQIDGDWWVFTNNSFPETRKFIRRAAFLAGLEVAIEKLT